MYHTARSSKRTRRLRRVWTDWFDRHRHRLAGTVRRPHAWFCPCKRSLPSAYEPTRRIRPPTTTRSVPSGRWRRWRERSCAIEIRSWRQRAIYRSNRSFEMLRRVACATREAGSAASFNFRYLIGILFWTQYFIKSVNYNVCVKLFFRLFYVNLLSKLSKTHSFV